MKMSMTGKYVDITKHKVIMENGKPKVDEQGKQILTGEVEHIDDFKNQITLSGLNYFGSENPIRYMYLSSETEEPSQHDTTLNNTLAKASVGGATSYNPVVDLDNMTVRCRILYRSEFPAGSGTGNITKTAVGMSDTATNPYIFSSALVKDTNGDTTVITKLGDEILKISYMLEVIFNIEEEVSTINISGEDYIVTTRIANVNNTKLGQFYGTMFDYPSVISSTSPLKDIDSQPETTYYQSDRGDVTPHRYVNNSMQRKFDFYFAIDRGNYPDGIKSFTVSLFTSFTLQMGFAHSVTGAGIPKKNTERLNLGTLYFNWGLLDATST